MAGERVIKAIKRTGLAIATAGTIAFGADTIITGVTAHSQGLQELSPERTAFIDDFRGRRSSLEIALATAGILLYSGGRILEHRRENPDYTFRRFITGS